MQLTTVCKGALLILSPFAHMNVRMDDHFKALQLFHLFGGIHQMPIYQRPLLLLPLLSNWRRKFTNFCFSGFKTAGTSGCQQ